MKFYRMSREYRKLKFCLAVLTISASLAACVTHQTMTFRSADKPPVRTQATLYKPDGAGPFPGVVLMHAGDGVREHDHDYAKTLVDWGYVTIVVDTYGTRGIPNTRSIGYKKAALHQLADAYGAFSYLVSMPEVDAQRIGIIGFSRGGHTVLNALTVSKHLPSYLKGAFKKPGRFRAGVSYYPHCVEVEESVFDGSLLILIGDKDRERNLRCSQKVVKNAKAQGVEATVVVYPGAAHLFDRVRNRRYDPKATADAENHVKRFLAKHLKGRTGS